MSLYVRQHAWLNAVPERAKNDKSETPRLTRLEKMRQDRRDPDFEPVMPEVQAGHLLLYLFEIGPVMTVGGYPAPVSHQEIESWQRLTGIELQPWEVRYFHRLSSVYMGEMTRAEKLNAKEPSLEVGMTTFDPAVVARGLQEKLRELARR